MAEVVDMSLHVFNSDVGEGVPISPHNGFDDETMEEPHVLFLVLGRGEIVQLLIEWR